MTIIIQLKMKAKSRIVLIMLLLFSFNLMYSQILNIPVTKKVVDLSFSPDGQYIAVCLETNSKDVVIYLWDKLGGLIKTYKSLTESDLCEINSISISPDSKYILAGGMVNKSGQIMMWDMDNGKLIYTTGYTRPVDAISFSPDGKYFVATSLYKQTIDVWSVSPPKYIKSLKGLTNGANTMVFSHDGKYIYTGSEDKAIMQWDFEKGEMVRKIVGHKYPIDEINISHDGKFLIGGDHNGNICLWNLADGNLLKSILGHEGPVTSLCFSPDDKYIISGSEDKTSKVFETSSGILNRTVNHKDKITTVDISPDGKIIATGSSDKSIKLWNSNIESVTATEQIAQKTTEILNIGTEPVIIWQLPFREIDTSKAKNYTLHAFIQSTSQLKSVMIYHNSATSEFDLTSYRTSSSGLYNLTLEYNISLDNGNNSVIVRASNTAGTTTSDIRSVYYNIPVRIADNEVVWEAPLSDNAITDNGKFKVKACIKSNTKINQISLFLNNSMWAFERTQSVPQESADCKLKYEKDIDLQTGNNEIKIEAVNEDNLKISAIRNVIFQEFKTEKRLALVIGNSKYMHGEFLLNPANDAKAMTKVLEKVGFEVESYTDADQKTVKMAMDQFGEKLGNYQVGLFYYAGHGVQVNGNNYIIPVDANLYVENDVEYDCVEVGRILGKMEDSGCETNIIILDACRDNPFERKWGGRSVKTQGLAFMNAPSGSIIAYSTAPGKTASDGTGENGLYTSALLKYIQVPNLVLEDVFKNVRSELEKVSEGRQIPWEMSSLKGNFYFQRESSQPAFR
jgi:WD40 repeat protein